ncbi:MAG: hypothetical protein SGPRY_013452, partial [Prymnesium sp.]
MLGSNLGLAASPKPQPRSPDELVRRAVQTVSQLLASVGGSSSDAAPSCEQQALIADISNLFSAMKLLLYGEPDSPPNKQTALDLAREVLQTELLQDLLPQLPILDFECRKDISQVFSNLLRKQVDGQHITVVWLEAHRGTLEILLHGYTQPTVALHYGVMLRECVRHERLARLILPTSEHDSFYALFGYIESPYFDVASDAFASLKDILTKHKALVSSFLETSYTQFFEHYMRLVTSENYVTKRQSVKLLGYEAFHVFKIFVANPHKEGRVLDVLLRNQEKLINFMRDFQTERADDQ